MKAFWAWFWANNETGLDGCGNTVGELLVVLVLCASLGVAIATAVATLHGWQEREYERRTAKAGFGHYIVGEDGSPEFTTIQPKP